MRRFEYVRIEYEEKSFELPKRSTSKSAGYDISLAEDLIIKPGEVAYGKTGLKVLMNDDEFLMIVPRSSLAKKHGVRLFNTIGIIDADYANNIDNGGHIHVVLYNFTNETKEIKKGERLVQGIFLKYLRVDSDDSSAVRKGGFGSTNS